MVSSYLSPSVSKNNCEKLIPIFVKFSNQFLSFKKRQFRQDGAKSKSTKFYVMVSSYLSPSVSKNNCEKLIPIFVKFSNQFLSFKKRQFRQDGAKSKSTKFYVKK